MGRQTRVLLHRRAAAPRRRRRAFHATGVPRSVRGAHSRSAADVIDRHVYREPAGRRLLVFRTHVTTCGTHGGDYLIEADAMFAVAAKSHARRVDGLAGRYRVAFDARDLDKPGDRVAGQPQAVLHRDLSGILDLL